MSVKAGGYSDMTRRKNESLPVAALNELRQRFAGARRHKLVKTREDIEQRTDSAPEVDQLAADRAGHLGFQPYTDGTVYGTNKGIDADVAWLGPTDPERLGYQTQKPMGLLERIIRSACPEGGTVLDAYCGCGTTIAVAQALGCEWIGIDITYQAISVILKRLEDTFNKETVNAVMLDGIPRDMESAYALANKKDDRLRKEFEKWATLTYTNNRAIINEKKGADAGIDGRAYFMTGKSDNAKIVFQVKSGNVKRGDIATLRGDMEAEGAPLTVLISLEEPTKPMVVAAKAAGRYRHEMMGRDYDRISIVKIREILEDGKRLEIPMSMEVLKSAQRESAETQLELVPLRQ
jgi:DNA methylase/Restriction endonuclease